ncbi:hypothetical protein KEM54_002652 [Ascosphaera aggregata]|nr:hypothetical protein KEM54_002652 [Ascosphaera aggregata]
MLQVADLEECLDLWQECFTKSLNRDGHRDPHSWLALTIYHLSAVLLQTSLDEIQKAAGNAFASGHAVSAANARNSYDRLVKTNPVGHESYLHGLEVVTLSLQEPSMISSSTSIQPPLWRDYGGFIGVLIIWAYSMKQNQPRRSSLASINLSPSLPSSVAANSGGDALKSMYDREQKAPMAESQEVKSLQTDLPKLVHLVCERLSASTWEISIEASRILRSLGERSRNLYKQS